MRKLIAHIAEHIAFYRVIVTLVLLLTAALLVWRPRIVLQIMRYGTAALCLFLAAWNLVTLLVRR